MNEKLNNIPHILWINLDRSHQRKVHMLDLFKKNHITNHHRIEAVDGEKLNNVNRLPHKTLIEVAVRASHLKALKHFVDNSEIIGDKCIIAEDDLDFKFLPFWEKDFLSYIKMYDDISWDIIQLSVHFIILSRAERFVEKFNFNEPHLRDTRYLSAGAYLITLEWAKKVLEKEQFNGNVGEYCNKFNPEIVTQLKNERSFVADSHFLFPPKTTYTLPLFSYNNKFVSQIGNNLSRQRNCELLMIKNLWKKKAK